MSKDVVFEDEEIKKENPVVKFIKDNWFELALLGVGAVGIGKLTNSYSKYLKKSMSKPTGIDKASTNMMMSGVYTQGKLDAYREMAQMNLPEINK